MWKHQHLLGIEDLSAEDIDAVLDHADKWFDRAGERKTTFLKGRTIINLFFEASTRTRTSFEAAGKRLGADVVNVSSSGSSVSKGETLLDTAKNLEAMRADALVVRHSSSGAPAFLAGRVSCAIINAGDGAHEHPTQALLDAFTIRKAKGRIEGLVVAICGDITHSRVARSTRCSSGKRAPKCALPGRERCCPRGRNLGGDRARRAPARSGPSPRCLPCSAGNAAPSRTSRTPPARAKAPPSLRPLLSTMP
jgi:aspartate carbamoyltransferase catalytic subunit